MAEDDFNDEDFEDENEQPEWALCFSPDGEPQQKLPRYLLVPESIRVFTGGFSIDGWTFPFPLVRRQMDWLIQMVDWWSGLDQSDENHRWLSGALEAIEAEYLRYAKSRPEKPPGWD